MTADGRAGRRRSKFPWSPEEDAELRRRVAAKEQPAQIAVAMERLIDGVRARAQVLRLRFALRVNPWRETLPTKIERLRRERAEREGSG